MQGEYCQSKTLSCCYSQWVTYSVPVARLIWREKANDSVETIYSTPPPETLYGLFVAHSNATDTPLAYVVHEWTGRGILNLH